LPQPRDLAENQPEADDQHRLPADEQPLVDLDGDAAERPQQGGHDHRNQRERRVLERELPIGHLPRGERHGLLEVQLDVALVGEQRARRRGRSREHEDHVRQEQQHERRAPRVRVGRRALRHGGSLAVEERPPR
jgi:hypothetical protein